MRKEKLKRIKIIRGLPPQDAEFSEYDWDTLSRALLTALQQTGSQYHYERAYNAVNTLPEGMRLNEAMMVAFWSRFIQLYPFHNSNQAYKILVNLVLTTGRFVRGGPASWSYYEQRWNEIESNFSEGWSGGESKGDLSQNNLSLGQVLTDEEEKLEAYNSRFKAYCDDNPCPGRSLTDWESFIYCWDKLGYRTNDDLTGCWRNHRGICREISPGSVPSIQVEPYIIKIIRQSFPCQATIWPNEGRAYYDFETCDRANMPICRVCFKPEDWITAQRIAQEYLKGIPDSSYGQDEYGQATATGGPISTATKGQLMAMINDLDKFKEFLKGFGFQDVRTIKQMAEGAIWSRFNNQIHKLQASYPAVQDDFSILRYDIYDQMLKEAFQDALGSYNAEIPACRETGSLEIMQTYIAEMMKTFRTRGEVPSANLLINLIAKAIIEVFETGPYSKLKASFEMRVSEIYRIIEKQFANKTGFGLDIAKTKEYIRIMATEKYSRTGDTPGQVAEQQAEIDRQKAETEARIKEINRYANELTRQQLYQLALKLVSETYNMIKLDYPVIAGGALHPKAYDSMKDYVFQVIRSNPNANSISDFDIREAIENVASGSVYLGIKRGIELSQAIVEKEIFDQFNADVRTYFTAYSGRTWTKQGQAIDQSLLTTLLSQTPDKVIESLSKKSGFRFSNNAILIIRQYILKFIKDQGWLLPAGA